VLKKRNNRLNKSKNWLRRDEVGGATKSAQEST
jgi:hypothetical protein